VGAHLVDAGALVRCDSAVPPRGARWLLDAERGYHSRLVGDRVRVQTFVDAVRAVVRPGDVVIDAGTGAGVLALAALSAGAERVFAIEAGGIAEIAARVFRDNAVADRVTLVRGDARLVDLAERADVLVTETIGANPFDEGILDVVAALRRHLKPGARFVPRAVALSVAPLDVDDETLGASIPRSADLAYWKDQYGFNFDALAPAGPPASALLFDTVRTWMLSAAPVSAVTAALDVEAPPILEGAANIIVNRSGRISAIGIGFDLDLDGVRRLDSWSPAWRSPSWDLSVVRLDAPLVARAGDQVRVTVRQPSSGDVPSVSVAMA
jgi:protein arginine N-methyltransferase 1